MSGGAVQGPQRFGRYVLLDRMGVGGMAEVFRAVVPGAEGFKRDLVVKKILAGQAQTASFIEMFVHEARISALLHHPNVVQVFDFGQVDGNYFLAMELLRGGNLRALLRALRERRRPLPVCIAAHIIHQVALGLAYAHSLTSAHGEPLNIVHRDVSPSNIMCLRTGGVKLLDFGIAQALGEIDSSEAKPGAVAIKGKLRYMAPERVLNQKQDHRVDLFALGAVLWETLTGERLFQGKTTEDKLESLLNKPIPAPSSVRDDVPLSLDAVVAKALQRDPTQRYATGQEMADELEGIVAETKYHSRMLPALLNELFGSAPSAAQIALSALPPELLTVETSPSQGDDRTPALAMPPKEARTRGSRVLLVVAGASALVGLSLAGVSRLGAPSGTAHATASEKAASATAPVAAAAPVAALPRAPEPPPEAAPVLAEPPAVAPADSPVSRAAPSPPPKPRRASAKPTHRLATGRIAQGLSINPFAEAAARGAKKK